MSMHHFSHNSEASSFCGMSLLIEEENLDMAAKIIKENNIKTEGIVKLENSIWNKPVKT